MYEAFIARTRRVQELMDEQQVDALLVLGSEDYFYFTGDTRRQPRALIPRKGEPTLFVFASEIQEAGTQTWISDIRGYRGLHEMMLGIISILKEMGLEKPRVALEMEFATPHFLVERFKTANPTVEVVDAKSLVSPLRRRKDAEEVEQIQRADEMAFCRPTEEAPEVLTEADVVVISGSAIVHHSLDDLLSLCASAREVIVAGPTASMYPGPLFKRGVTVLGGIAIRDGEEMVRLVAEGGSGYFFGSSAEKVVLRLREGPATVSAPSGHQGASSQVKRSARLSSPAQAPCGHASLTG